ncbi:hypothetical protein [Reyranella sp.]|uniref:hypothetical protein n=1 Tax=Reyranella sp. TaxID=1929291 RepID=UPI003BA87279
MSSTDELLDALFAALTAEDGKPALDPRMALRSDPAAGSYFIPAPRPALSLDEMRRPDREGPLAELQHVLADLPADRRAALIERVTALHAALATAAQGEGEAEPSSLIYALH